MLLNKLSEEQYLMAYIEGHVDVIDISLCTDMRRVVAHVLSERGRPENEAVLSLWLKETGVDIPVSNFFGQSLNGNGLSSLVEGLSYLAVRRQLGESGQRMTRLAGDFDVQNDALYGTVTQELLEIFSPLQRLEGEIDETEEAQAWFRDHLAGVATDGLHQTWCPIMDSIIGPLGPGILLVVAADTSQGKTIWANQIAIDLARQGWTVLTSSPDMGKNKLWMRYVAMTSGVSYHKINAHSSERPTLTPYEIDKLLDADRELGALNIKVARTSVVPELVALARKYKANAVFADYLTLFRMPNVPGDDYLNYEQVASATLRLAELTKDMLVVIASQVTSKIPDLAHLAWGRNLPQRADIVLWLDRDLLTGVTTVHVLKNRGGPIGKVPYYVIPASMQPIELEYTKQGYSLAL